MNLRKDITCSQALGQVEAGSEVQQPRVDDIILFKQYKKARKYVYASINGSV